MTVLVTGATGKVGRHVVAGLLAAGEQVRAMTRSPETAALPEGVATVRGDLADPAGLDAALAGVDRVYLFPLPGTAEEFTARAVKAGVGRIVVLSSVAAEYADGDYSGDHHTAVERAVEASGVEWTHVRPGEFMANLLDWWAPSIRAEGVVRAPFGATRSAPVHEADIADVAVTALLEDGHAGKAYSFAGPESLAKTEQVRVLSEVLGREIRFEELTTDGARALWLGQGMPAAAVDWLLQDPVDVPVGPTAERVTGRPARTFAQWVADHRADF
ncbi:NAD(P)H-binding protein [Streptomyces roseofulvus]|uniref:NAD(P)H-binding protein n=2 Tax=Streptomyces TaxID=1883 RepID=A0ABU4KHJ9_9ACTN|nr:NAD(P)H-binding protein [Streptomyces roseolus]MDX2297277.1 NAD(P)H-binding protein [Streptomyces roseolus]